MAAQHRREDGRVTTRMTRAGHRNQPAPGGAKGELASGREVAFPLFQTRQAPVLGADGGEVARSQEPGGANGLFPAAGGPDGAVAAPALRVPSTRRSARQGRKCWPLSLSAGDTGKLPPVPTSPRLCQRPGGSLHPVRRPPCVLQRWWPQAAPARGKHPAGAPHLSRWPPGACQHSPRPLLVAAGLGESQVLAEQHRQTRLRLGRHTGALRGAPRSRVGRARCQLRRDLSPHRPGRWQTHRRWHLGSPPPWGPPSPGSPAVRHALLAGRPGHQRGPPRGSRCRGPPGRSPALLLLLLLLLRPLLLAVAVVAAFPQDVVHLWGGGPRVSARPVMPQRAHPRVPTRRSAARPLPAPRIAARHSGPDAHVLRVQTQAPQRQTRVSERSGRSGSTCPAQLAAQSLASCRPQGGRAPRVPVTLRRSRQARVPGRDSSSDSACAGAAPCHQARGPAVAGAA